MSENAIILLVILNLPVYLLIGWAIFDSWGGFLTTLEDSTRRRLYSTLGNASSALKLFFFITSCIAVIFGEYKLILCWCG